MDIENVSNFRRRILSASVVNCRNGVAQFSVTGVAFLWHQAGGELDQNGDFM
jgi:tRNA U38,U39,U40 pseudouridine synthase TruA